MEWDQLLFRGILRVWQKVTRQELDPALVARRVLFEDEKKRLELVAKALTGRAIQLHRAEQAGGATGGTFFLPAACAFFSTKEKNRDFYLFRVCFLSADLCLAQNALFENRDTQDIFSWMLRCWPGMEEWSKGLLEEAASQKGDGDERLFRYLWARGTEEEDFSGIPLYQDPLKEGMQEEKEKEDKIFSQKKAPPREKVEILQVNQKAMQDYTLMHQFEKVETLDDFNGRWRDMDGADELEAHEEALQELDLRQVVRADSVTHSVYQADFWSSSFAPEIEEDQSAQPFLWYPEWNDKKKSLLEQHCKVYLEKADREDERYREDVLKTQRVTMQRLRKRLMYFRNMRQVLRRQREGDFPDLDALVDVFAQRRVGRFDEERMYLDRRLLHRDFAVSILMDISLSTDSFTGGRRVLDIEKQAVLLFGQLLQEQGEQFRVDAFWSKTRNQCHYVHVKDFREGWRSASSKIAGLRPVGYTRIGPALRHATALLKDQKARRRWILLLSDGKPNDYDRYEGKHGIADVRQAIREAEQLGIRVYALAVEQEARHYLPQMLGHANYQILSDPEELPEAMFFFYTRLLSS